jgi:hypothetical protein
MSSQTRKNIKLSSLEDPMKVALLALVSSGFALISMSVEANTLVGGWAISTSATGITAGAVPFQVAPTVQATPATNFSLSAGRVNTNGTVNNGLAYAAANHSTTGAYTVQAQVGEVGFFGPQEVISFAEASVLQTTVLTNNTGALQTVTATAHIDAGLLARANIVSPIVYPPTTRNVDVSSVSWLLRLNGAIVGYTNVILGAKGNVLAGQSPANTFSLNGTNSTRLGSAIPIVTAAANQSFSVYSWGAQDFDFTLRDLMLGDNIITVEAIASTRTLNAPIPFRGNFNPDAPQPITNFAYFGDPLSFSSNGGAPAISFASVTTNNPPSGNVPLPGSALLILVGLLALQRAARPYALDQLSSK